MQIVKTNHLDNLDNLDHLDHFDHHIHLNHLEHLEHLDNLDNLNHLSHPNHPDHPDHPNRICIAYFVLFQIILIYVQILLSITLLEQRSDAVYAIFWVDAPNFLSVNAKTMFFCILLCKLAYSMGVSLRGDITHFVLMIHALLTQILKHCFCAIFSCVKNIA